MLLDAGSGMDSGRARLGNWRAVGLIAGVNPVALIFGLEDVAFECQFDARTRAGVVAEPPQIAEADDGLLDGDETWKCHVAFGSARVAGTSR